MFTAAALTPSPLCLLISLTSDCRLPSVGVMLVVLPPTVIPTGPPLVTWEPRPLMLPDMSTWAAAVCWTVKDSVAGFAQGLAVAVTLSEEDLAATESRAPLDVSACAAVISVDIFELMLRYALSRDCSVES